MPYVHPLFFSKAFLAKKAVKTKARWLTLPLLPTTGRSFYVYNGQKYVQVIYKKEMANFKLGSFAVTKIIGYKPKIVKKKRKR